MPISVVIIVKIASELIRAIYCFHRLMYITCFPHNYDQKSLNRHDLFEYLLFLRRTKKKTQRKEKDRDNMVLHMHVENCIRLCDRHISSDYHSCLVLQPYSYITLLHDWNWKQLSHHNLLKFVSSHITFISLCIIPTKLTFNYNLVQRINTTFLNCLIASLVERFNREWKATGNPMLIQDYLTINYRLFRTAEIWTVS